MRVELRIHVLNFFVLLSPVGRRLRGTNPAGLMLTSSMTRRSENSDLCFIYVICLKARFRQYLLKVKVIAWYISWPSLLYRQWLYRSCFTLDWRKHYSLYSWEIDENLWSLLIFLVTCAHDDHTNCPPTGYHNTWYATRYLWNLYVYFGGGYICNFFVSFSFLLTA